MFVGETLIQITGSNPLDGDDNIVGPVQIGNAIYYYGKPYNTFYVSNIQYKIHLYLGQSATFIPVQS